jgi:hypothetical protein
MASYAVNPFPFLITKDGKSENTKSKREIRYKSDFCGYWADALVFFRAFALSRSRDSFAKMLQFLVNLAA